MNSQLAILVLVDVEAALARRSLEGSTYLMDNAQYMGSSGEGTGSLVTAVIGNQILNWLVIGIDLSGRQPFPALVGVGGEAVAKQIMVPQLFDSPALDGGLGLWWGATVDANVAGVYVCTLEFDLAGLRMEAEYGLRAETAFTMGRTRTAARPPPWTCGAGSLRSSSPSARSPTNCTRATSGSGRRGRGPASTST